VADWWESKEAWQSMEEADPGFTEWAHKYKLEHGFYPGGGQDESLAQAISNREWSRGVASGRGSGPTQQEWVSHYYRPDELGDTGQYWPYAVAAINKAFPETGAKTNNTPGFNDIVAQKQYDIMAPYWEQMARFGVGKAGGTTSGTGADWEDILRQEAEAQGIGEYYPILRAIVDQESGGDPTAVNAQTMATGLMQIMPSDVSDRYNGMFDDRPTSAELLDVAVNIREGVADFKRKLDAANGDIVTALTNYSGGYDTSKYAAPVIERAQRYGGGSPAPQPTYNEPNPDNAYMMREDGGQTKPEPEVPETFEPGPQAYEALTRAGLYKPTPEAQAALAGTIKPSTRRQTVAQDPTQQTLGAIINALINAYPQAAGTAIDRWNQGFDARQRGIGRVNEAIENLPPSPIDPNAPMGEPGNLEQLYREAVTDWATPKKPGPVSPTEALNRMRQSPDTQERPAPGVVWERLYLDPNSSDMQRQTALRMLGLRNDADFQLTQVAANRPEVQAAKQAALDMWGQGNTRVDLPNQNLFVTPEGADGAATILGGAAALAAGGVGMVVGPSAFAIAEIGKAVGNSIANTPIIGEWVQELAASASNALPKVTMPTLGGVGQAALTALSQGGFLPEQILGMFAIAQMTPEQLQRWSDMEAARQQVFDLRAAGLEDTPEYRQALYRWQQIEAQEKARYEAALGVDVSGVPGIQQLEAFVGGFYSPEELENATSAPPTLEAARQVAIDPTKRAAAWEAARAGYWTSPGLTALTYMQLLGVDTGDWEATIQKAAQYQNLGNEMLGQIPFDLYNLRLFEAPGKAVYNRFMNRGKNYWIADANKTLDAVHDDILRSGQKRSAISTIMPGATVDARRAEMINKLSVSMQMATDGAETAEDYVRLLAGYTADPVGFLNKRGLPKSQGMLEGAAILREYAGFGVKEIRVKRYADDLAEAVQRYKTAKAAGTATDEMLENVKRLRRQLNTAKRAEPAESLAKRLDRIADQGAKVHGLAGADLREYVQEEAFGLLQKTIDGLVPESSANLLEKGLRPVMRNRFYQGFMKTLVTGHMGLNPGWLMRNITSDAAISLIDGYNPFRSAKSVRKFIDEFGIEPRSVSKAAPIGSQVGAGGSDIGIMGIQSHVERFGGEKVYTEAASRTLRNLNRQAIDNYLAAAPKGMFTPAQEAYLRHIGERSLSEKQFRTEMAKVFNGTAKVDDILGPATWKQAYDLNVEEELKKILDAPDDTARAAVRKAQNKTLDTYVEKHPLKDNPRVDSAEGQAIQQIRKNPQTYDPAKMGAEALDEHIAELDELVPKATGTEGIPENRLQWRSNVHAKRYRPYLDAKAKVLKATEDIANLPKSAEAERIWGNLVSAQEQADTAFAHARKVWDDAKDALAKNGRTPEVNGMFIHADNAWAKAAKEGSRELNKAYQEYMNWHKSVTGKWPTTPSAGKAAVGTSTASAPTPKAVARRPWEMTRTELHQAKTARPGAYNDENWLDFSNKAPVFRDAADDAIKRGLTARQFADEMKAKFPQNKRGTIEWEDYYRWRRYYTGQDWKATQAGASFAGAPMGGDLDWMDDSHYRAVLEALVAGEKVPPNVLATYPDLAKAASDPNELAKIVNTFNSRTDVSKPIAAAPTPKAGTQGAQTVAERLAVQDAEELASFEAALRANPYLSSATEDQIQQLLQEFKTGSVETRDALRQQLGTPKAATETAEAAPQAARAEEAAGAVPEAAAATDVLPTPGSEFARVYGPDARLKEPWQMTRKEWNDFHGKMRIDSNKMGLDNNYFYGVEEAQVEAAMEWNRRFHDLQAPVKTKAGWEQLKADDLNMHKQLIREAINKGYPVPDNVLREYPDLAKRGGVAGAIADETGSLDLASIKGQVEHTKRFLDDVAERLKGRPGLSKVEPLTDEAKKYLRENYAEYMKFLNKNRLVAANYGEHARHFAYHNYDGKTSADQLASLLLMYPFWSTRTYAKLPLRVMQHPGLVAKYLRYKRWLEEENKDLPEWYRNKIVIDNTKIPWLPEELIIDLEASINPYNSMNREPFERPRQLEGEGIDRYLGEYMQFVEKYGFNAHFGIIAAYAAAKAADGDAEAAKAAMGYPAPALRALRDITAWMGLNNGWGIELVPWHWRQGLQTPFTGADYYALRRIGGQIGKLAMSGEITPLEAREAAIAYARGETDNPIIRKALEAETDQRSVFNILGFFTSFSVKGRSGYDRELDQFYADRDALYAQAANMTDEEFRQALSEFYNDPAHYHYRVADIARSEVDEAETAYIRDIWWNSIPPGQRDVALAKYGDDETGAILERMLDKDGPGIAGLSVEERTRVTMFMAALSSKYPPPDQEMFEEWQAVKEAWNGLEAATAEKFGSPDAISATDALNMMRQGKGQPAQSEFDRILEAYWAADESTRKAMREQYPVIDEYFDWKEAYMENDPLLMWYYGDVPRDQATDNLWNLYNAFTDAGMAQTKVDLAEDLDAMGADMGIPGCELNEEGEGCFTRFFRNQDTRDYEKIPNELLLAWTLYVASEAAKRGVDPNVYRTQEGEAPGTQTLAPEPSGGDPAIVTSPWQMGESEPTRTGLPGTEYEETYGAGASSGATTGLEVPTDVPGRATTTLPPNRPGLAAPGVDVAPATPGQGPGGSDGKPMAAGDGGAELGTPSASTGEKSFWDFDFTEEQFERAAPEMDALRSERNRLYQMCENGVEQACNQLKDDRFNVFSTPEWLFYYEQIAPGWRLQDSGFYDDPTIKQWLDPATREGVTAEAALKRMQELKAALPDLSFGDPKEYSQARDEQEQWKETSENLMPGTMAYRQAQAKYAEEHPIWAKYYLRPQTAASLAEYAARGWTYAPRSGGGGSSDGGGTSGGSGYRYTGPWFSPDTFRGANTSRRPAMQDSDLWQRVVLAALSRTKQ